METTQCNFGGTAAIVVLLGMSCCMLMFSVYYGQNSALQVAFDRSSRLPRETGEQIALIIPKLWRRDVFFKVCVLLCSICS